MIGTLAERAVAAGFEVAIVTGDKDFFQLVHDGIKVYNPKDDGTWYDADGVKEKFGVTPEQVVDVLALMGDSIDNIKGVPGIGEKGARDLIATYGSLEELLAHASEVTNKRYREGLLNHADDARQSRELARIRTDVPVDFDPEALRYRGASRERCFELFTRLGLPLARAWSSRRPPQTVGKDYATVETTRRRARRSPASCARPGGSACACCPTRPSAMRAGIVGLSFSTGPRHARYVPMARPRPDEGLFSSAWRRRRRRRRPGVDRDAALALLKPLLEDDAIAQGRARPEVRRDRARAARRHAARARDRHDARQLPARREPLVAPARGSGARAHRLQGAHARRTSAAAAPRPSRSPTFPSRRALDYAGERADLALQLVDDAAASC